MYPSSASPTQTNRPLDSVVTVEEADVVSVLVRVVEAVDVGVRDTVEVEVIEAVLVTVVLPDGVKDKVTVEVTVEESVAEADVVLDEDTELDPVNEFVDDGDVELVKVVDAELDPEVVFVDVTVDVTVVDGVERTQPASLAYPLVAVIAMLKLSAVVSHPVLSRR